MQGTVKSFSPKRGYGFIVTDDGAEYFAHFSQIDMSGYKTLEPGQTVEFTGVSTERGFNAHNIRVVEQVGAGC